MAKNEKTLIKPTLANIGLGDVVITNDNYYNAASIEKNPTAALIVPLVVWVVGGIGWGSMLGGLGAALSAIFDLGIPATIASVAGIVGGVALYNQDLEPMDRTDVKVIVDSHRFTYDVIKSKIFGNDVIENNSQDINDGSVQENENESVLIGSTDQPSVAEL